MGNTNGNGYRIFHRCSLPAWKRFPVGLKILLLAIAIIDDLGAIVVIALFYGGHINWFALAISGGLYAFCFCAINGI